MASKATTIKKILIALGIALVLVLLIAEWQLQFLRSAPRIDRKSLADKSVIQVVVQPQKAPAFVHSLTEQQSGRSIPQGLFALALPYETGALFYEGSDDNAVPMIAYVSMPHFGKIAERMALSRPLNSLDKNIQWEQATAISPSTGVLTAQGSVPPDTTTSETVFYQWGDHRPLTSIPLTGNHFAEFTFDNRAGQAYLIMASYMTAHGLDFGDDHNNILASFQFVISIRGHANISDDNKLSLFIGVEIQPENKNKLGVGALHGGIKELFAEMGRRLEANHGVTVEGGSEWNENVIEFNYTFSDATKVATLFTQGKLL